MKKESQETAMKEIPPSSGKKKSRKGFWLRFAGITLCVLSLLFLLGLGVYHGILNYYLNKINIVTEEENLIFATQRLTEETIPEETVTEEEITQTETLEETDFHGQFNVNDLPLICDTKDVTNILLLATDSRVKGGAGRSDVMMLVSINESTGKIVLCSFLRDLYAHYPTEPKNPINGGYDKLNHAHAYGGPELTMAVLKETFNIDVKYYAKVDFTAFVQVVDTMGGLDLYLTEAEVNVINSCEKESAASINMVDYVVSPLAVTEGVQHINGIQALCHARNRTIGSDWARTQRQRAIISAMVSKVGTLSLSRINELLNTMLPLITTNMQKDMMKDMIGNIPSYIGYDMESTKIPQEGTYSSVNYNLIPDLKKNCYYLYEVIYGEPPVTAPSSVSAS